MTPRVLAEQISGWKCLLLRWRRLRKVQFEKMSQQIYFRNVETQYELYEEVCIWTNYLASGERSIQLAQFIFQSLVTLDRALSSLWFDLLAFSISTFPISGGHGRMQVHAIRFIGLVNTPIHRDNNVGLLYFTGILWGLNGGFGR